MYRSRKCFRNNLSITGREISEIFLSKQKIFVVGKLRSHGQGNKLSLIIPDTYVIYVNSKNEIYL